ncbi:MAG: DNA-binding protein [Parcubacteria group bacterium CG08_land_8_20_14_0_20_48_21]|nr:MAG: hypothetical protein AUK21_04425 [Parcubacteria group bacterium CG2_30_48_51]PIS32683.1 MAG: DNA-binding protein [Parcubacteria group bacterium CG08_land_8_20_14_0_20_48_21]PIW79024.1 MAG: DNA-binding protein [Parcubacteria group bacterium CG_4_8_14_3_um_filter_48_16]PIY77961.1 MAG: DNA-binding protein [Parcubacteria group bacterium CG_4_10_14_0_8_um_filter_48_154]PIZ77563.1 MAG: DNA-binding protein [bacterium CG_4_10_14_0_2_um_filter_48_144]PJC39669.1 MAG: DNA-binding protein [Parcuba
MNKAELITAVAEKTSLPRKQVEEVVESMLEMIVRTLKKGGSVHLTSFGTFLARRREARMGVHPRNPQQRIHMPAVTVAKFQTGKGLKDALKHHDATSL